MTSVLVCVVVTDNADEIFDVDTTDADDDKGRELVVYFVATSTGVVVNSFIVFRCTLVVEVKCSVLVTVSVAEIDNTIILSIHQIS